LAWAGRALSVTKSHRIQFQTPARNRRRLINWFQGDAIVQDKLTDAGHPSGTVIRSYVVDDAGSIVKLTVPTGETGAGAYLVTSNGHGAALTWDWFHSNM
jgi:hypothetical protein